MMNSQAAEIGLPSEEGAWLDRVERRANWGLAISAALLVVGAILVATSSSAAAAFLAIFFGLGFIWTFARWRRLIPHARESLRQAPLDLLLERRFRLSRIESSRSRLWALDGQERPLAWFGPSMQWSQPLFMTAEMLPARVYGAPTSGSVVVVSCSRGLLVGRIGLSRFDENAHPVAPPRGLGWLFKPRSLRLSRD
jgi:cobalamin biosynthesis protein CobD/CbiB